MGNTVLKRDNEFNLKKIYWDSDGNLRHGVSERNRDEEVIKLLEADTSDEADPTKLWMIIPSRWIRLWLQFSYFKVGEPPGPIDMFLLLQEDSSVPGKWRPKHTLKPPSTKPGEEETPGHYRRISLQAWLLLIDLYSVVGFAIAVRGTPYDDLTRWRVFKDPRSINVDLLPEPIVIKEKGEEEKKEEKRESIASFNFFGKSKKVENEGGSGKGVGGGGGGGGGGGAKTI